MFTLFIQLCSSQSYTGLYGNKKRDEQAYKYGIMKQKENVKSKRKHTMVRLELPFLALFGSPLTPEENIWLPDEFSPQRTAAPEDGADQSSASEPEQ